MLRQTRSRHSSKVKNGDTGSLLGEHNGPRPHSTRVIRGQHTLGSAGDLVVLSHSGSGLLAVSYESDG